MISKSQKSSLENEATLCDVFNGEVLELGLNPTKYSKFKMVFNRIRTHGEQRLTIMNRCDVIEGKLKENSGHIDNLLVKSVVNGNDKKVNKRVIEDDLNITKESLKQ